MNRGAIRYKQSMAVGWVDPEKNNLIRRRVGEWVKFLNRGGMTSDLQPVLQYLEILSIKIAKLEAEQIVARNMLGKLAARIHQVEYAEMEALQMRMELTTKQALLPTLMQGIAVLSETEVRKHLGIE